MRRLIVTRAGTEATGASRQGVLASCGEDSSWNGSAASLVEFVRGERKLGMKKQRIERKLPEKKKETIAD